MLRALLLLNRPQWQSFVLGYEVKLLVIDEDFVLEGPEDEDVSHAIVWYGIKVGVELDKSVGRADPMGHLGAIVGF